tara:strand:+ start:8 stop:580 length:573 start_codon:yes stop_codon:yes gene_type:complete
MSEKFRPDDMETSTGSYLGIIPATITNFEDRTSEFDWADMFIDITLTSPNSQYPYTMSVLGSYDKEPNGDIKSCSLLKRAYNFFDSIGFEGGPDKTGAMVNKAGDVIENFEKHLHDNYLKQLANKTFFVYAYKEQAKNGKLYTKVYPKLGTDEKDFEGYVNFLKSKNLIKEVTETGNVVSSAVNTGTQLF